MHSRNEPSTNTANERSFNSSSASSPRTSRTDSALPAADGGVCGRVRQYTAISTEASAPMRSGRAVASAPSRPMICCTAMNPMVPSTRMRGNSRPGSLMFANEMEFVSARVGMKQSVYARKIHAKLEKVVCVVARYNRAAPARCSPASIRSVATNRSAIMPTMNGEIMAAIAGIMYARPTSFPFAFSTVPRKVPSVTSHEP